MGDLKPLWSDSNDEEAVDAMSCTDSDFVIFNLYEDVKCLNERNAELEAKILKLEQQKGSLVGKLRKYEYKAVVR